MTNDKSMQSNNNSLDPKTSDSNLPKTTTGDDSINPRNVSTSRYKAINEQFGSIKNYGDQKDIPINQIQSANPEDLGNELLNPKIFDSHVIGEQSVSGDMADPASDDDTLEMSHEMGLRLDEDDEHPQEIDIASEIDKAEEYHRTY